MHQLIELECRSLCFILEVFSYRDFEFLCCAMDAKSASIVRLQDREVVRWTKFRRLFTAHRLEEFDTKPLKNSFENPTKNDGKPRKFDVV